LSRITHGIAGAIELSDLSGQPCAFSTEFLGALGCAPDRGVFEFPADFF
jgi:hypothetical protein